MVSAGVAGQNHPAPELPRCKTGLGQIYHWGKSGLGQIYPRGKTGLGYFYPHQATFTPPDSHVYYQYIYGHFYPIYTIYTNGQ